MKHQINHRDMQRSGTKNGAIPREGACSRPAKREGRGKAANEWGKTEGSIRPIVTRKARESGESGIASAKAERSNLGEKIS